MDEVNFIPHSRQRKASFLHSFMIGNCFADENGIEFHDYRDNVLCYHLTFAQANMLINSCEYYHENPMPTILSEAFKISDLKTKKESICQRLSQLSLKEIKLIQIFLFNQHLVHLKPPSIGYQALTALRFGDPKRFNLMMAQKAQQAEKTLPELIQDFINKVKAEK